MCIDSQAVTNAQNKSLKQEMATETMTTDDKLEIKKLTGGSLVDFKPVFSRDGEYIFVISKDLVKCYNAVTAEWVRDLCPETENPLISAEIDKSQRHRLIVCDNSGNLSHWQWKTGLLETKSKLNFHKILSFNLVYFKNYAVVVAENENGKVEVSCVNYIDGKVLHNYDLPDFRDSQTFSVSVAAKGLNYFCITQGSRLFTIDIQSTKARKMYKNEFKDHFTTVVCHPEHDTIATGDVRGRIRLWRNVLNNEGRPKIDVYHWHHTPVESIAFSCSGTIFYSGASEAVLVKWIINEPNNKTFLPRMSSAIAHIAVGGENSKIVVATKDNAIHFYDAQLSLLSMIQNFTWMPNDFTGVNPFPVGLQVNPRTQSIVLNGRSGHLQFFSTHTNSLLYNLDITDQNYQCPEQNKLVFNTRVTQCALNINWMVTSEVWDDFEHTSEVRMKFWQYCESKQSFVLNTNVEQPHDKGINKLQFSSTHSMKNLLCASVGKDNTLKLWALEDSKNIYRQGKVWMNVAVITYKNRPVHSTAFSSDCSLLAAGFGNTLCIFDTETLQMKCALTAPNAADGSANKVQINIGKEKKSKKTEEMLNKRQFYLNQAKLMLKGEKHELMKDVTAEAKRNVTLNKLKKLEKLSESQRESAFSQIMSLSDLSFDQKINALQTLDLQFDVFGLKKDIAEHLYKRRTTVKQVLRQLPGDLRKLKRDQKFQKLATYSLLQRRRVKNNEKQGKLKWFEHFVESQLPDYVKRSFKIKENAENAENEEKSLPLKAPVQIKNILFGNEDHCHLVCVCTDTKILVWNLLTLRLQSSFNYSTKFASIDTQTNFIAVFSEENQLLVFHINSAHVVYCRRNMEDLYGMTWVPRRYPKARFNSLDWQAASQLYFLNTRQELIYIDAESNDASTQKSKLYLNNLDERQTNYSTPFAAIIADKSTNSAKKDFQYWSSNQLGMQGESVVKELKRFQSHTMAPLHLLSNNFILSLSKKSTEKVTEEPKDLKSEMTAEENAELTSSGFDEEEFEEDSTLFLDRKELILKMEATKNMKIKDSNAEFVTTKGNFDFNF
ncbi:uncharacterized protein LOC134830199 [Culicoides brevitarsis]|uniref:uncharacterized protein LOC134830199 n=1 Tax=Culicoides brevitarsis TaxID=469753 RepID=UPI00307BB15B